MSAKSLVKDEVHTLVRKNPVTGYLERVPFVGSLRNKPTGWRVDRGIAPSRAMAREYGTV